VARVDEDELGERKPWAGALVLCCLSACVNSGDIALRPHLHPPIATIPLVPYVGPQLAIQADVGGRPGLFLFDTGGGVTMLTPQAAEALGCTPWGQITGFRMRGDRIDALRCDRVAIGIGALRLTPPTVGVLDFTKLLPASAPRLDGMLALDALADRTITIDLAGRQLIVESAESLATRIQHSTEVVVRFSRDAAGLALSPMVAVETPRGRLWMEIDCGSDATVVVGKHAATALGLDSNVKGAQALTMALAGGVPVRTTATVRDLIMDGNIGVPVLESWVLTLDLARQRMWIAPRECVTTPRTPCPSVTGKSSTDGRIAQVDREIRRDLHL
jgi:hypothetical protein